MTKTSPGFAAATLDDFEQTVLEASGQGPVLVDFWADWCAPCKALEPVLHQVKTQLGEQLTIIKVNADEEASLAAQFAVRGLPTLLLFRDGRAVGQLVGVQPAANIVALITPYMVRPAEKLINAALDQREQGDRAAAERLLTEAVTSEPDNGAAIRALIPLQAISGHRDEARALHAKLLRTDRESSWGVALATLIDLAQLAAEAPEQSVLTTRLAEQPQDSSSRAALAARCLIDGDQCRAMDELLELLRRDRDYEDELGRRGLLAVFELLGEHSALAKDYRRRMAAALH